MTKVHSFISLKNAIKAYECQLYYCRSCISQSACFRSDRVLAVTAWRRQDWRGGGGGGVLFHSFSLFRPDLNMWKERLVETSTWNDDTHSSGALHVKTEKNLNIVYFRYFITDVEEMRSEDISKTILVFLFLLACDQQVLTSRWNVAHTQAAPPSYVVMSALWVPIWLYTVYLSVWVN